LILSSTKELSGLELFFEKDFKYLDVTSNIETYINIVLDKSHIKSVDISQQKEIFNRAKHFYTLFCENSKYIGYSILLYQKKHFKDEVELYLTTDVDEIY